MGEPKDSSTQTSKTQNLANLELRHRRRARCEDRIRIAKDAGLRNLPLKEFAGNQIWCAIVMLASDLIAWSQLIGFDAEREARRWEPKKLRLRVFTIPEAVARHSRRILLHIKESAAGAHLAITARKRLHAAPAAAG